jgi:hypothetical protein
MNLSTVKPAEGRGPSSVIGVELASCLICAEAIRILLQRGPSMLAPNYLQFDAYRQKLKKGRLTGGNKNWLQRLKRRLVVKRLCKMGLDSAFATSLC